VSADFLPVFFLLLHVLVLNVLKADFLANEYTENQNEVECESSEGLPEGDVARGGYTQHNVKPYVCETSKYCGHYESAKFLESLDLNSG
jgi:hypothetical protein